MKKIPWSRDGYKMDFGILWAVYIIIIMESWSFFLLRFEYIRSGFVGIMVVLVCWIGMVKVWIKVARCCENKCDNYDWMVKYYNWDWIVNYET